MDVDAIEYISALEQFIEENDISKSDICLVGSSCLACRGFRSNNDLDICISSEIKSRVQSENIKTPGGIEISRNKYTTIGIDDDELIFNADYYDVVDGLKIVRPEISFSYKLTREKEKDKADRVYFEELIKQGEWDWDIFQYTYSKSYRESSISEFFRQLFNSGAKDTTIQSLQYARRESPLFIKNGIKTCDTFLRINSISTSELLSMQYDNNGFQRYDLVASYANTKGWTGSDEPWVRDLVAESSERETTHQPKQSTDSCAVTPFGNIVDPIHTGRLLASSPEAIHISISPANRTESFTEKRLRASGMTNRELRSLRRWKYTLLDDFGLLFYFILWPTVEKDHDAMTEMVASKLHIVDSFSVQFEDVDEFIENVYENQDTMFWSIERKKNFMKKYSGRAKVLKVECPNPRFRDGIALEVEEIKKDIRSKYTQKYGDELYHAILHSTDDFEDNRHLKSVIEADLSKREER